MRQPADSLVATVPVRSFEKEGASENWGEYPCDEKGRPKQRLVLSLDVMGANADELPGCMRPLDSDFELGFISCLDPISNEKVILRAGHFEQVCMTNSSVPKHASDRTLSLPGCSRLRLTGHSFVPVLRISAESREIQ